MQRVRAYAPAPPWCVCPPARCPTLRFPACFHLACVHATHRRPRLLDAAPPGRRAAGCMRACTPCMHDAGCMHVPACRDMVALTTGSLSAASELTLASDGWRVLHVAAVSNPGAGGEGEGGDTLRPRTGPGDCRAMRACCDASFVLGWEGRGVLMPPTAHGGRLATCTLCKKGRAVRVLEGNVSVGR